MYTECPDCELAYSSPEDNRRHARYHMRVLPLLDEARRMSGCHTFRWATFEQLKADACAVFEGYDGLTHTDEERTAAAIQYLRVRFCRDAWGAIASNGWARFLDFYPDFRTYVRSEYAHYAHEFDATIHAGVSALYGPVLLSVEDYRAREAEYLSVHASMASNAAKDRALLAIRDRYARRLLAANEREGGAQ